MQPPACREVPFPRQNRGAKKTVRGFRPPSDYGRFPFPNTAPANAPTAVTIRSPKPSPSPNLPNLHPHLSVVNMVILLFFLRVIRSPDVGSSPHTCKGHTIIEQQPRQSEMDLRNVLCVSGAL